MGHLWVFSPPFFVWVWEDKRIVQSAVGKTLAAKFCQMDLLLFQTRLFCIRVMNQLNLKK